MNLKRQVLVTEHRSGRSANTVQTSSDVVVICDKTDIILTNAALETRRAVESNALLEDEEAFVAEFWKKVRDKVEARITPCAPTYVCASPSLHDSDPPRPSETVLIYPFAQTEMSAPPPLFSVRSHGLSAERSDQRCRSLAQ